MNLRYQICACLYQGTACEVFLVRDIVTSQLYALKRIVRHHAKFSDAYLRAVYQREACMLGWLQHERIPHLISAFEEEQYRCILMEYSRCFLIAYTGLQQRAKASAVVPAAGRTSPVSP